MNLTTNKKGSTLVGALLAGVISVSAFLALGKAISGSAKVGRGTQELIFASAETIELLEYLISLDPSALKTRLSDKRFCRGINRLNETTSPNAPPVLDADPLADLIEPSLQGAHRSYRVEVADLANPHILNPNPTICNRSIGNYALGPNERYLVSVETSWISNGERHNSTMAGLVGGSTP